MKTRPLGLGCVLAVVAVLALLALGGGAWWFFMGQYTTAAVPPASPVQVYLLSPASGQDVSAGDFVLVELQAAAPAALSWSEVFVDGKSLGAVRDSPERASWTWQAWPAGVHVLAGRAQAADGQSGESQTVIVNVVAADETMQVMAGASETLAQVGAKFGASPAQMAAANPKLDPSKPLPDGKPVKVPTGGSQPPGGGGAGAGGSGPGAGSVPFFINWELKLSGQVDKSYCYLSDGSGAWDKVPKQPFQFFGGLSNLYTQVFDVTPPIEATIQAQCWGWLGGVLKYLGQGQTKVINAGPIQVIGEGFQLTGLPKWPEGKEEKFLGGGGPTVPPPFALRESKDAADCTAHAAPIVGPFICNTLMNAPVKEYLVLEWEWQPGLPAPDKNWANDIEGYEIYEIMPDTEAPPKFLKEVKPMGAKAAAVPLPWHNYCFGVQAFANVPEYGGKLVSEMSTYCAGQTPLMKKITLLALENWITAVDMLEQGDDCLGFDDGFSGYEEGMGEVFAGSYDVDIPGEDCYQNVYYNSAVKFKIPASPLPAGAVMQKATLRYYHIYLDDTVYFGPIEVPPPYASLGTCVSAVGKANKDWTGLSDADHWIYLYGLGLYATPTISAPKFAGTGVTVTSVVSEWLKNPASNHGFIIYGKNPPGGNNSSCISGLGEFRLEIQYFAPKQ